GRQFGAGDLESNSSCPIRHHSPRLGRSTFRERIKTPRSLALLLLAPLNGPTTGRNSRSLRISIVENLQQKCTRKQHSPVLGGDLFAPRETQRDHTDLLHWS